MTVVKQSTGVIRLGNGAATSFTFPFGAGSPSDIKLYLLDEHDVGTEVPSNQYSVTINQSDETGTLTTNFPDGPLPFNERIFIGRETDNTQTVIVNSQTAYDPAVVMRVWDKLTRLVQELRYDVNRAAKVPIGQFDPDGIYAEELSANLSRLVSISDDISRVASVDTSVANVSSISDAVLTVESHKDSIEIVSSVSEEVQSVGESILDVVAVSGDLTHVNTVAENIDSVTPVGENIAKVVAVADNIDEVVDVSENMADLLVATTSAINLVGGNTGQYLTKKSFDDFDYEWQNPLGGGDMVSTLYDPNGVEDDAFDMDNMLDGTSKVAMTVAERAAVAGTVRHDTPQSLTSGERVQAKTNLGFTISTSAPSGGEDGDIWLQYEA